MTLKEFDFREQDTGIHLSITPLDKERCLGIAAASIQSEEAVIEHFLVIRSARGQKIGTRFSERIENWARERGATRAVIFIDEGSTGSKEYEEFTLRDFFERKGYQQDTPFRLAKSLKTAP